MSRRDTIIVAVLVNAALLMILFATAVRSDKDDPVEQHKQIQIAKTPSVEKKLHEEELLNQYVASIPTLAETRNDSLSFTEEIELTYTPPQLIEGRKRIETVKSDARYADVTVKKGDYLEKIAHANNTTVAAILQANNLTSTQLKIGQILKVPLSEGKPNSVPASVSEGEYYVVKEGDNPWLIASRNNLRLEELLRLNGLDDQKARRLRPGDRLRIK